MSALGNPEPLTNGLLAIGLMPAGLGGVSIKLSDAAAISVADGTSTTVPEPASLLLILAGGAALAAATGRRCGHRMNPPSGTVRR